MDVAYLSGKGMGCFGGSIYGVVSFLEWVDACFEFLGLLLAVLKCAAKVE